MNLLSAPAPAPRYWKLYQHTETPGFEQLEQECTGDQRQPQGQEDYWAAALWSTAEVVPHLGPRVNRYLSDLCHGVGPAALFQELIS